MESLSPSCGAESAAALSVYSQSSGSGDRSFTTPYELWHGLCADGVTWGKAYDQMLQAYPDLPHYYLVVGRHQFAEGMVYLAYTEGGDGQADEIFRLSRREVAVWRSFPEGFMGQFCLMGLDRGNEDYFPAMVSVSRMEVGESTHSPAYKTEEGGRLEKLSGFESVVRSLRGELAPLKHEVISKAERLQAVRAGDQSASSAEVRRWQRLLGIYLSELKERNLQIPLGEESLAACLDPALEGGSRREEVSPDPSAGQLERWVHELLASSSSSFPSDTEDVSDLEVESMSTEVSQEAQSQERCETESESSGATARSWKRWALYGGGAAFLLVTLGLGAFLLTCIKGIQRSLKSRTIS